MNQNKLKRLFELARHEPAPAAPDDFAADVLRAVLREPAIQWLQATTLFEQLNLLFPRIAFAAIAVIALSVAVDYALTAAGVPGLGDGVTALSAQWFLTPAGL